MNTCNQASPRADGGAPMGTHTGNPAELTSVKLETKSSSSAAPVDVMTRVSSKQPVVTGINPRRPGGSEHEEPLLSRC